jgi:hypothetical protein
MHHRQYNTLIVLYSLAVLGLSLAPRSHQYYDYTFDPYNYNKKPVQKQSEMSDAAAIGVLICFAAFGCGCVFCCRAICNRNQTQPTSFGIPVQQQQYGAGVPQYANNNPYPQSQYPPIYRPSPQIPPNLNNSMNPYIIENADRFTQTCDFCNIKNRAGEEPRILVGCPSKHFFHLTCISSAVRPMSFLCPRCGQNCPETLALYCSSCKDNNVVINASEFAHPSGGLDIDAVKGRYG